MNKKNSRKDYLLKNTVIFAISNIATKLITFLLVPLYTYCLSKEEYGTVDLLLTISTVLIPIITLNIAEAIYRFSMDKGINNNKILSITIPLVVFGIICSFLTIPILSFFSKFSEYSVLYCFYINSSILSQISLTNLKGQEKLKEFSFGNILNAFLIAILNVYFLKFMNMGIRGYFLANIIAHFVTFLYSFFSGKVYNNILKFEFDKNLFKEMIGYSFVLIPTSFMWWVINSSDRIMVTTLVSAAANGIYAISYKIPSILTTVVSIFNQAWMFSAITEKDSKDKEIFTNKIFRLLYIFIFILSIVILIFLKTFFRFYVSSSFYEAWKFVPFLVFGSIFMTLGTFVSTSYNVYKDSKGFLFSGTMGAVINIILNFCLIPTIGVYGAAIATCISYISVFVYRILDTRKYVRIKFNYEYILPVISLIIVSFSLFINNIYSYIIQFIILFLTIFVYKNDIISIMQNILKIRKK